MIAISSHRALSDCPPEIVRNQIRAHQSWSKVFDEILLFGKPETELTCPKTAFLDAEDFPLISSLCMAASMTDDFACIINADIVVGANLPAILRDVLNRGGTCATSHRYEFIGENLNTAQVVDNGVDFFAAEPRLWRLAANNVPPTYRIGHSAFDTWLLGFFNTMEPHRFYDITRRTAIFHPRHSDRKRQYHITVSHDKFTSACGFPFMRL